MMCMVFFDFKSQSGRTYYLTSTAKVKSKDVQNSLVEVLNKFVEKFDKAHSDKTSPICTDKLSVYYVKGNKIMADATAEFKDGEKPTITSNLWVAHPTMYSWTFDSTFCGCIDD